MPHKIAINGFGRIGRNVVRAALQDPGVEFVAVNDITDNETLAHLLKYDSVHGRLDAEIRFDEEAITVGGKRIRVFSEKDPAKIPWETTGAEIVIESTGRFTKRDDAAQHLRGSVRKVLISAPAKGADVTLAMGINNERYDKDKHHVISGASCTTNSLAPVVKVLHDSFGVVHGLMTTVHAYTNDQKLLDLPHEDLRRARSAAVSIIPTSTGAAKAIGEVLPALAGKLDGFALRVPVIDGSVTDLTVELEKNVSLDALRDAFKAAANGPLRGILEFSEEELVSTDIIGNPHSAIVDGAFMRKVGDRLYKLLSWYDNEWGYSNRVVDLVKLVLR